MNNNRFSTTPPPSKNSLSEEYLAFVQWLCDHLDHRQGKQCSSGVTGDSYYPVLKPGDLFKFIAMYDVPDGSFAVAIVHDQTVFARVTHENGNPVLDIFGKFNERLVVTKELAESMPVIILGKITELLPK